MDKESTIKSTCGICYNGCGVLIHLIDGKPCKIEKDPDSPIQGNKLCSKGLASLEYLDHPDRLTHPLKRIGGRGEGKWQKISWDDALNIVAHEFDESRKRHGPESVAFLRGSAKGYQDTWFQRFANVFGSPNYATAAYVCFYPTMLASMVTYGFLASPHYAYPPECLVVWGSNSMANHPVEYDRTQDALQKGMKLIVIDPRGIGLGRDANLWLRLKPGSDLALALAMINVIIDEEMYDKNFVENWTVGFDSLASHVRDYTPGRIADITWLEPESIVKAARLYARSSPACIEWGNGIEHNINSFQTGRAICILQAITGNLGIPGGESQWLSTPVLLRGSPELEMREKMPEETRQKRISGELHLLPGQRDSPPPNIVESILEERPYAIRKAFVQSSNLLVTCPNSRRIYKALMKIDFFALSDLFMTPTANLADIVLPAASFLEFDNVVQPARYPIFQIQQKVAEVGQARSDYWILKELAKRLGLGNFFWDDEEQALDAILEPAGLGFAEFRNVLTIMEGRQYRGYLSRPFNTVSGKVELYSGQLEQLGFDPLPRYRESPEVPQQEYPLIFTSWKSDFYRHSGGKQISALRSNRPEPLVSMHPELARSLDIQEGDWVYIENQRGRIQQKAAFDSSLDQRVVCVDFGWWFPEKGASNHYGWAESNVNMLTDDCPPYSREMGTARLRGVPCKVYKLQK